MIYERFGENHIISGMDCFRIMFRVEIAVKFPWIVFILCILNFPTLEISKNRIFFEHRPILNIEQDFHFPNWVEASMHAAWRFFSFLSNFWSVFFSGNFGFCLDCRCRFLTYSDRPTFWSFLLAYLQLNFWVFPELALVFSLKKYRLKNPSNSLVWNGFKRRKKRQMGIEVAWFSNCMEGIDRCSAIMITDWWFLFGQSRFLHGIDSGRQKSALSHVGPLGYAQCNNRSLATAFGLLIGRKFSLNQSESR